MQFDISKRCADYLRSYSENKFGIIIKSSHAHELVAAYFGYSSRAALLADTKCPISNLKKAEIIVLSLTAGIKKRRKELNDLPENLPNDIAEGIYCHLYDEKLIAQNIWLTFQDLGSALADQHLKSHPLFFNDQKILRDGVKVEFYHDGVRINVYREYISPSLLLSFQPGTRGIFHIFEFKRTAGYIGYVKADHHWTEGETLDAAIKKIDNFKKRSLNNHRLTKDVQISKEFDLTFSDWLKKQKNRDTPLGDLARKRGFTDQSDGWPSYDNLEAYKDHLKFGNPPWGTTPMLEKAWKTYKAFIKRKGSVLANNQPICLVTEKYESRAIVFVKNITPIHYSKRTIERFVAGDKAWISFDGRKAIPVTVLDVDEMYYTFIVERPLKKAGDQLYLRLDEVRSTPELACINCVTS